ncbi:ComEC/Rec2 family competence protein [Massilia cellulosiltytica]|nr:hypothetical protein [Telluria cellulosilytica]
MRVRASRTESAFEETRARPVTGVLDVWLLDVGQGACIYIVWPEGTSIVMVDCGTTKNGGATSAQMSDWVNPKNSQAGHVTLLVTHGHRNHTSNFREGAIEPQYIEKMMLGGLPQDHSKSFMGWASGAKSRPTYFTAAEFKANDVRFECGGAKFDLLTVNATEAPGVRHEESKENADSAVVKLSFAGYSIVLPSDAELVTERSTMANADKNGVDLGDTTLLISSHHGAESGNSNSATWLARLRPKAGLFSANVDYKTYSHPRCNTVKNFHAYVEEVGDEFDLACGNDRSASSLTLKRRLFGTYDNGHGRARFSTAGVSYACQVSTPACDAQLAPEEMP